MASAPHREHDNVERGDQSSLGSLQELPKTRYASKVAITALPKSRGRKAVYSHVDLYKMVEKIANSLRERGVRPDTVCAIAMPNCVEMVVYFLAVVWVGAIAAPIDVRLELDEVVRALRASKATTLVSPLVNDDEVDDNVLYQRMKQAAETLDLVEWHLTRTTNEGVVLETHGRRAAQGAAWAGGASDFRVNENQVAVHMVRVLQEDTLVLPLTHHNLAAAIRMFSHTFNLDATNVTVLARPWYTVDALTAMLATIYSGGHLVLPGELPQPNANFLNLCSDYKVDWFSASPSFLTTLSSHFQSDSSTAPKFKFIRCLSGNLDTSIVRTLKKVFDCPILEGYGTPETCGIASCNRSIKVRAGTKGIAVAGCSIKIFDEESRLPVPGSGRGLIGVAGANVTSGYVDNIEASRELVVKCENESGIEIVFFLTGDEGFLDNDGFLHVDCTSGDADLRQFSWERGLVVRRKKKQAMEKARLEQEELERLEREAVEENTRREKEEAEQQERIAAKEKAKREEMEPLEREAAEENAKHELQEAERREHITAKEKLKCEEQERLEREAVEQGKGSKCEAAKKEECPECEPVMATGPEVLESDGTKEKSREPDAEKGDVSTSQGASEKVSREGEERNETQVEGLEIGDGAQGSAGKEESSENRSRTPDDDQKTSSKTGDATKEAEQKGRKVRFDESAVKSSRRKKSNPKVRSEKQTPGKKSMAKQTASEGDGTVLNTSQKMNRRSTGSSTDNNCKGAHRLMRRISAGSVSSKNCEDDDNIPIQERLNNIVAAQRRLMRRKSKRDVAQ